MMIESITVTTNSGRKYKIDPKEAIDIAIPLSDGNNNPNCYYSAIPQFKTIRGDGFIGSVIEGGIVNHKAVAFAPHANGTHTECFGHISSDQEGTISQQVKEFIFLAELISVRPSRINNDSVIRAQDILDKTDLETEGIIIRSLPNEDSKLTRNYSGTNPAYFEPTLFETLAARNIKHFLTDLPSVDKEEDGGKLSSHKTFWGFPDHIRYDCTITELIFVPDNVKDGLYILNLMVPSFELDAAPSRPVLYRTTEV